MRFEDATPEQLRARLAELQAREVLAAEIERAYVATHNGQEDRIIILRSRVPGAAGPKAEGPRPRPHQAEMRWAHFSEDRHPELYGKLRAAILDILADVDPRKYDRDEFGALK